MAKRRLIKKINEVSDEELAQTSELNTDVNPAANATLGASTSTQIAQQEQQIRSLRAELEEFRKREAEFKQKEEENFRLSQQNKQLNLKFETGQEQLEKLQAEKEELNQLLNQKELEISDLEQIDLTNAADTDALEEINHLKTQLDSLTRENIENKEQMNALRTSLNEKKAEINQQITEKEKEINQLRNELTNAQNKADKDEALETINMELEELNKKLQSTEGQNQELNDQISKLLEQMKELKEENRVLKDKESSLVAGKDDFVSNERIDELKKELESALKDKSELEVTLGQIKGLNDKYSVQKDVFEAELTSLREQYKEKETELMSLKSEMETLRNLSSTEEIKGEQLAELLQAKQQINDLLLKNQSLQEEALKSQQEIGEVMVSAKKEANRIISEAQVEAKHMINSAELEMLNIGNRAKNISNEVEESKNEVMAIYRELEERLSKLSRLDKTNG